MTVEATKAITIFYCYAREDKTLRDELDKHLTPLRRSGLITSWYDREVNPGQEWEKEIDAHLNTAHIVLLLVSPDFVDSDYCYGKEMIRALERHDAGDARVIPILMRSVYWEKAPFSKLQMLPANAKPVSRWPDRDDALEDVARGIYKAVKEVVAQLERASSQPPETTQKTKEQWFGEGTMLVISERYGEALVAFEQAIRLDPDYVVAYNGKGNALWGLQLYSQALDAYQQATHLDPNYAAAYYNKGFAFERLGKKREAQQAYNRARELGYER